MRQSRNIEFEESVDKLIKQNNKRGKGANPEKLIPTILLAILQVVVDIQGRIEDRGW